MVEVQGHVLDAFEMMWGLHPGPVMLVHSSRDILAVNAAARDAGVPVGIKCHSLCGREKICPTCKANKALKQNAAIRECDYSEVLKKFMDGFWIPVAGEKDIYVHFGNDITEYVRPELLGS